MKDFLLIAPNNACGYKDTWPLIKDGTINVGYTLMTGKMPFFKVPDDYPIETKLYRTEEDGNYIQVGICWLTTLPKTVPPINPTKAYDETAHPKLDNYDAIEVGRWTNIPKDYYGLMSVPITFLKRWNRNEYEMVNDDVVRNARLQGKKLFYRLLIRKT